LLPKVSRVSLTAAKVSYTKTGVIELFQNINVVPCYHHAILSKKNVDNILYFIVKIGKE